MASNTYYVHDTNTYPYLAHDKVIGNSALANEAIERALGHYRNIKKPAAHEVSFEADNLARAEQELEVARRCLALALAWSDTPELRDRTSRVKANFDQLAGAIAAKGAQIRRGASRRYDPAYRSIDAGSYDMSSYCYE